MTLLPSLRVIRYTLDASLSAARLVLVTLAFVSVFWSAVTPFTLAGEGVRARFDRDDAAVWQAMVSVLGKWPLLEVDRVAGVVRTDWREERQSKRWDRLLTQRDRRHRLELQLAQELEGTVVSVTLRTQSRPMGRYSAPWGEEAADRKRELALLDAIERALAQPGPNAELR